MCCMRLCNIQYDCVLLETIARLTGDASISFYVWYLCGCEPCKTLPGLVQILATYPFRICDDLCRSLSLRLLSPKDWLSRNRRRSGGAVCLVSGVECSVCEMIERSCIMLIMHGTLILCLLALCWTIIRPNGGHSSILCLMLRSHEGPRTEMLP